MNNITIINSIDNESRVPLVDQLYRIVKHRYVDKGIKGSKLPTEFQLAKEYGVNPAVVRRAVAKLQKDGFVFRRPRHGSFISGRAKQKLSIAYYEESMYSFSAFLDRFQTAYPAINISRTVLSAHGYNEITDSLVADGKLDLIRISAGMFPSCDAPKKFLSLNSFYRDHNNLTLRSPWEAFKCDYTHYGVPLVFGPVVMACNLDMFHEADVDLPNGIWTLAEFAGTAEKLTRRCPGGVAPEQYGFLCPNFINRWPMFVYNQGGRLWDKEKEIFSVGEPEAMEGLAFLRRMIVDEKTCAPFYGCSNIYRLFARKKAAMTLISYHTIIALREQLKFKWGVVSFPAGCNPASLMIVDGMAVARNTVNLDAVNSFLAFCCSKEAQQFLADQGGPAPVRMDVVPLSQMSLPVNYGLYRQPLARLVFPELLNNSAASQVLSDETLLYLNGMQGAEEYKANLAAYAGNRNGMMHEGVA